MAELAREFDAAARASTLDRARGAPEHAGRLLDGPALDVDEENGFALVSGQLRQGGRDLDLVLTLSDAVTRIDEGSLTAEAFIRQTHRITDAISSAAVEAGVHDDAMQPRGHGRVAAKTVSPAKGRYERILERGKLGPGDMLAVDTQRGVVLHNKDIKEELASLRPYQAWLERSVNHVSSGRAGLGQIMSFRTAQAVLGPLEALNASAHTPMPPAMAAAADARVRVKKAFGYSKEDEEMVLKPSMVISGKDCPKQASVSEVAARTLAVLKRTVPAAVPGIAFLSGGQSDELASAHLDAMNRLGGGPWALTFSYGRALQQPSLKAWKGAPANVPAAQAASRRSGFR